jgi:hypothetical protein
MSTDSAMTIGNETSPGDTPTTRTSLAELALLFLRLVGHPVFSQPEPTADPTIFKVNHPCGAQILRSELALIRCPRR